MASQSDNTRSQQSDKPKRREFLFVAATSLVAVGGAAAVWPLIDSMNPSASIRALPGAQDFDLGQIPVGEYRRTLFEGKPIHVWHRRNTDIAAASADDLTVQFRDPALDADRVQRPQWLVFDATCPDKGCIVTGQGDRFSGDFNGWFCPCCASHFDTSGRVRRGPSPRNLLIPPYTFVNETTIRFRRADTFISF